MRTKTCVITSTGKRVCGRPIAKASGAMKGGTLYLVIDPFGRQKLETRSYREAQTYAKKLAVATGEPTKIRTISAAGTGSETSDTETVYPGARPYRWTPSEF